MIASMSSSNLPQIIGTPNCYIQNDRLSREGVRPKDSACLDLYVPDGKNSRLSEMSPKCSGMIFYAGNLLFIIRLHNLMENQIFGVDMISSDFYAMEATSMTWISERVAIMPQVSTLVIITFQYLSCVPSPPLMADNNLSPARSQIYLGASDSKGGHQK